MEELAGVLIPRRAAYIRTIIGELERLHSHMLWLGVAGHELGFDTLFMYSWRDRELVLDVLAELTGNRVNYGINTFGGVRRDIEAGQIDIVNKAVDTLDDRFKYYLDLASGEKTLLMRMANVGRLSHEDALRLGAAGPVARAAEVDRDVRRDDPYAAYDEIPFKVITDAHADVLGRLIVRVKEMLESTRIIHYALEHLPAGSISEPKFPRKIPPGEVLSRYEAPRGTTSTLFVQTERISPSALRYAPRRWPMPHPWRICSRAAIWPMFPSSSRRSTPASPALIESRWYAT